MINYYGAKYQAMGIENLLNLHASYATKYSDSEAMLLTDKIRAEIERRDAERIALLAEVERLRAQITALRWIPVTERLPPIDDEVAVIPSVCRDYQVWGRDGSDVCVHLERDGIREWRDTAENLVAHGVTHWREIGAPEDES